MQATSRQLKGEGMKGIRELQDDARRNSHEIKLLRKAIQKIAAMAGNPDAAEGCRNIIAECKELLGGDSCR